MAHGPDVLDWRIADSATVDHASELTVDELAHGYDATVIASREAGAKGDLHGVSWAGQLALRLDAEIADITGEPAYVHPMSTSSVPPSNVISVGLAAAVAHGHRI
jgi:hypothetical protein